MKALRYLNKYLIRYKHSLLLGTSFTLLSNVFSIIPSHAVKQTFNLVQESLTAYQLTASTSQKATIYQELVRGLIIYSTLALAAVIIKGILSFLTRRSILVVGKRIEYALKNEIYSHYQTLPLSFYRKHTTGDLMARISEDVNRVGMYLGPAIMHTISTATTFLMLIPYMFAINVKLTLYAVVPLPFLAGITYYVSTFLTQRAEAIQRQLSELTAFVQESFSGIRVLQAFSQESKFIKDFAKECNEYKQQALRLTAINAMFFPSVVGIIGLGIIAVVFVGGQEVMKGNMTPGNIAEFIMYLHMLSWPTFSVSLIANFVQRAVASQKRINEFLQEKNHVVSTKDLNRSIKGNIVFKKVSFTYPDSGIQALKDISFEVAVGKTIAIVGTTGAGKTTIANLLCRLYDADKGSIEIGDIPIQDYAIPSLRQQLGYVPQEVFLFADTIQNNIAFGAETATLAQIVEAAKQADIYESIQQLPNKMQTVLSERGTTLSGGQKQRIAIARAFIRSPKILVLDDCLSAVDTQTERSILQTMAKVIQGRTTIIISHSVASARLADHILVLDAGKIVEQGDPESLLAQQGIYYAMNKKQQLRT